VLIHNPSTSPVTDQLTMRYLDPAHEYVQRPLGSPLASTDPIQEQTRVRRHKWRVRAALNKEGGASQCAPNSVDG